MVEGTPQLSPKEQMHVRLVPAALGAVTEWQGAGLLTRGRASSACGGSIPSRSAAAAADRVASLVRYFSIVPGDSGGGPAQENQKGNPVRDRLQLKALEAENEALEAENEALRGEVRRIKAALAAAAACWRQLQDPALLPVVGGMVASIYESLSQDGDDDEPQDREQPAFVPSLSSQQVAFLRSACPGSPAEVPDRQRTASA